MTVVRTEVTSVDQMHALARRVAAVCRPGDLVILDGDLGSGKTTFVQGLGAALGIDEPITSPTFVIARCYRGPSTDLVHVDAYRLGSALELDDLDLDADVDASVTVVEWGSGKVEQLAADRLVIRVERSDAADDERRSVVIEGVGARWDDETLAGMVRTP